MASGLPAPFLEDITESFSEHNKIGAGGYGEVFKGVLNNGTEIAVKKLYDVHGLDDAQFNNEFSNLMRIQHKNIIRFIGYCNEIRHTAFELKGEYLLAKRIYKALCFEYLPGGSLDQHLYDESCGFDWCIRYKIIKGICEGLCYLHNGLQAPIFHLDLKPANVILDKNMEPKIADFGVSRPFSGSHTRTTTDIVGSLYYMAPEYMSKRQISNKNDIFSLGIIIMQIMAGQMGFNKFSEMSSPQQFMDLVINNWRDRITKFSKYVEEECQQVKRCIEIAVSCVEADRSRRPVISDVIRELEETETHITTEPSSKDTAIRVVKIGHWGGAGGSNHRDVEVSPDHLESLIIFSGEVIYALEFSYSDYSGKQHTAGPWGGNGPNNKGSKHNKIKLGRSEYVMEVSGTVGPFDAAPAGVITSLCLITNANTYGPFGEARGTPFQIPVQSNGSIVGFFVRAGWYLDAFGVYVNPTHKTIVEEQEGNDIVEEQEGNDKAPLAKIGPWGGNEGRLCDIKVAPHHLESVTAHSDIVINALEFSYSDCDGQKHTIGPWGGHGGTICTIEFGPSEFLRVIYGTTGSLTKESAAEVVTSLTLVTNRRTCGPFGQGVGGTPFQIPMRDNGSIVGFFGRADSVIHAIGVYANPKQDGIMEREAADVLGKSGPWGGRGGEAHYIDDEAGLPEPHRLVSVTIYSDIVIHSIEFSYMDRDGNEHTVGPWGGPGGNAYTIRLGPLESLQGISGTYGPLDAASPDTVVITSLSFATNQCLGYRPFGHGGGTPFTAPADSDGNIVGFFARAGSYLDALGVYTRTDYDL